MEVTMKYKTQKKDRVTSPDLPTYCRWFTEYLLLMSCRRNWCYFKETDLFVIIINIDSFHTFQPHTYARFCFGYEKIKMLKKLLNSQQTITQKNIKWC